MRAKRQIFIVFFTPLLGHFFMLASSGISVAQAQTQPAAATRKADPTSPEIGEADRLSLEIVKLYQARRYDEALPLAKRALKLRGKTLGENHPLVAEAVTNLAEIYLGKGNLQDAEPLLKRAVSIHEQNPQRDGLILGKTLDHLAALRLAKAEINHARELYRRAIAAKEMAAGTDHAEVVYSRNSLADIYVGQKDYAKAKPILEQVVAIRERVYGKSHAEVGRALERLACVLFKHNEKTESEGIEQRANHILYAQRLKKLEPLVLTPAAFDCRIVTAPRPDFPSAAKGRFRGQANILTEVEVDETGKVIAANMVSGDPVFKKSAELAALKAKFRPQVVDGQRVKFKGVLMHSFSVITSVVLLPGMVGRP